MNKPYTFLAIALGTTFVVLLPTLRNNWTNLDDPIYILENPLIRDISWDAIQKMFTTLQVNGSYNPVVLLSWALDYSLAGLSPKLFHITNLVLHLVTVILVFYLSVRLSKNTWVAFGTALLFGIHPMHVESVAWITSRKELLYTLFYIAGLIAYLWYLEKNTKFPRWYYFILCFALYVCSLLSKGSALTFPLILWAFDYLKKRKDVLKLLLEKIPFLILSIVFTYVSIRAQNEGEALLFREFYSVFDSLSVGFYGYLTYLTKVIVPYHLSGLHPYPTPSGTPVPWYFSAAAIPVLAIAAYCFYNIKTKRVLVFGFGFFFITLIPVIQVLSFAISVTADRFTYLPYFGLFYIISLGVVWLLENKPKLSVPAKVIIVVFLGILSFQTFTYSQMWKSSETVWSNIIRYYPDYFVSYVNRSEFRINNGELDKAMLDCNKAIELKKDYYLAYYNRAYIYQKKGDIAKAIRDYTLCITHNNESFQAYQNRGILYVQSKQIKKALEDFDVSIKLKPNDPYAFLNRASLFEKTGQYKQAIADASQALSLNSNMDKAYLVRGSSYQAMGQAQKAISDFKNSVKMNPKLVKPYVEQANIYFRLGRLEEAIENYKKAIQLGANQVDIYINLGIIFMNQSRYENALFYFNQAQKYDSTNYLVYLNRAILYKLMSDYQDALQDIDKSLELESDNEVAKEQKAQILELIQTSDKIN